MQGVRVLWVDCLGGLIAGAVVIVLVGWLSELYGLPRELLLFVGTANLCYGAYSLSLALRRRRPRALIVTLVVANTMWAVGCAISGLVLLRTASMFGLAHLFGEALFVGWLALLEWQRRADLSS